MTRVPAISYDPIIEATPFTLVDEIVPIKIRNIYPENHVTISAVIENENKVFVSYAHYKSDGDGIVDVMKFPSLGGTYSGIEPMGLFWSMVQAIGQRPGLRLMNKDATKPFKVEIFVGPGHVIVSDRQTAEQESIVSCVIERSYMAQGVTKYNMREFSSGTRLRGSFFIPAGDGPFPAVIDLFGTAGGLNDYRAALLASRGFLSLSLAYFGFEDLPDAVDIDLEYFIEAVDWLYSRPEALETGIGMVGVSKGAELVCKVSTLSPKVIAAVPINGASYLAIGRHVYQGKEIETGIGNFALYNESEEGMIFKDCYRMDNCVIPDDAILKIENAMNTEFLLIGGEDDLQNHPDNVRALERRLVAAGKQNYRTLMYPGAGHLIEPPYTPLTRVSYHKVVGGVMIWGGKVKQHALAQEDSWREIQDFLRKKIVNSEGKISRCSTSQRRYCNVTIDKPSSLVDERLNIKVSGLTTNQPVTITAVLEDEGKIYVSCGQYNADQQGRVDLSTDWCKGGTYTGVEPMGLFWSMTPAAGQRSGLRIIKKDVSSPFRIEISVLPEHIDVVDRPTAQKNPLAQEIVERYYKAENVRIVNVKEADRNTRVRGTLFLPPGDGPFPGVIDMFGTGGGLMEYRAALLASRGFASLALPYFRYDDLPEYLELQLEYFIEAIDWFHSQPQVRKSGIAAVGVSKGAELSIMMAILSRKVKAAVPINGNYYSNSAVHFLNGLEQPAGHPDMSFLKSTDEGLILKDCYWLNEVDEDAVIKIEDASHAKFLIIGCGDDQQAAPEHVGKIRERLEKHGLQNYSSIIYPGAGHLLEPPYMPLARASYHKLVGGVIVSGGTPKPHADAQEHSWQLIQKFLWQIIGQDRSSSKL